MDTADASVEYITSLQLTCDFSLIQWAQIHQVLLASHLSVVAPPNFSLLQSFLMSIAQKLWREIEWGVLGFPVHPWEMEVHG